MIDTIYVVTEYHYDEWVGDFSTEEPFRFFLTEKEAFDFCYKNGFEQRNNPRDDYYEYRIYKVTREDSI